MQKLPHLAKERLRTGAFPAAHPDPDVLTAFAERSLPQLERAKVMEHLALCGDCRDVLVLALPELQEVAAPPIVRRPWLSMPVIRWGAIAAALIVMASIGTIRYRQHSGQQTTAKMETPKLESSNVESPRIENPGIENPQTLHSSALATALKTPASANKTKIATAAPTPPSQGRQIANQQSVAALPSTAQPLVGRNVMHWGAGSVRTETNKESLAQHSSSAKAADVAGDTVASTPAPNHSNQTVTIEVQSAAPRVAVQSQENLVVAQSDPDSNSPYQNGAVVGKAKPAAASANSAAKFSMRAMPGPQWTITPTGGLQKSYDQGKTWQDVVVAARPRDDLSTMEATARDSNPASKKATAAPGSMQQVNKSAVPTIRAISVSGAEIWAGANEGILYHSVDAGDHWSAVTPAQGDITLTGDVVSVQFADSLHGNVATSTSELWNTADGGLHWSKQ